MYWGASVETQIPIYGVPKDFGMRIAVFADAGSVWDYKGPRLFPATGTSITTVDPFTGVDTERDDDPLVGRRRPDLGFAVRPDPHRLCACRSPRIRTTGCSSFASAAARDSDPL